MKTEMHFLTELRIFSSMLAEIFPLVKKCKEENPETGFESLRCGAKKRGEGRLGRDKFCGFARLRREAVSRETDYSNL